MYWVQLYGVTDRITSALHDLVMIPSRVHLAALLGCGVMIC